MKKIFILLSVLPTVLYGQQTITSVQSGNASNPLVWDCTCFPTTDDDIIINHAIAMDVDWAITAGGSITVNASGSLIQNGTHVLLVDGIGSQYLNYGASEFTDIAYTNGGTGVNTSNFLVTRALYIGAGSSYNNSGTLGGMDSLMTEGTFTNSGPCFSGNILNTGTYTNTGHIAGDSVGNTGVFNSLGGYMYFKAFGNTGTFSMTTSGFMDVTENWYNAGDFTLGAGLQIFAHNHFYNGDTLMGSANLHNNGTIEVTNDFYNNFVMDGSGNFCVGGNSYNSGPVNGTLDFCDNTGTDFDWNTGTIAGTVTFCQPGCYLGLDENTSEQVLLYPNPTEGELYIDAKGVYESCIIYALSGQKLFNFPVNGSKVDLGQLNAGTYFIQFLGDTNSAMMRVIVQ
jgi:hypothetical protein